MTLTLTLTLAMAVTLAVAMTLTQAVAVTLTPDPSCGCDTGHGRDPDLWGQHGLLTTSLALLPTGHAEEHSQGPPRPAALTDGTDRAGDPGREAEREETRC